MTKWDMRKLDFLFIIPGQNLAYKLAHLPISSCILHRMYIFIYDHDQIFLIWKIPNFLRIPSDLPKSSPSWPSSFITG